MKSAGIVIPTLTFDGLTVPAAVELVNSKAKKHADTVKPPWIAFHPKADADLTYKQL